MRLAELRGAGFAVSRTGTALFVEPASHLTDAHRAGIRRHKPEILRELAAEEAYRGGAIDRAREAASMLPEFRLSLIAGRLVICANCRHFEFASEPAQVGNCRLHGEALPFAPFLCPEFVLTQCPAAPAYAPTREVAP